MSAYVAVAALLFESHTLGPLVPGIAGWRKISNCIRAATAEERASIATVLRCWGRSIGADECDRALAACEATGARKEETCETEAD
jgi:hypothetical protein